jgi:hypothetical protein
MGNQGQEGTIDTPAEGDNTRMHFAQNGPEALFFLKHFIIITDQ